MELQVRQPFHSEMKRENEMKTLRRTKGCEKRIFVLDLHPAVRGKEADTAGLNGHDVHGADGRAGAPASVDPRTTARGREGFLKRFEQIYGSGAVAEFRTIVENPEKSLSDAGRHFGFTREYARQVYLNMYDTPYTKAYQRKRWQRKKRLWEKKAKESLRWQASLAIQEKLEAMGFDTAIVKKREGLQILADAYRLTLRLSSSYFMVGKKRYARFSLSRSCFARRCDFFVCVFRTGQDVTHYIVPRRFMPKSGFSIAVGATREESKYAYFKEAWHLVKRRPHVLPAWRFKNPGQMNAYSRLTHPNPISEEIRKAILNRLSDEGNMLAGLDRVDTTRRTEEGISVVP
jgi:hypothetical protein